MNFRCVISDGLILLVKDGDGVLKNRWNEVNDCNWHKEGMSPNWRTFRLDKAYERVCNVLGDPGRRAEEYEELLSLWRTVESSPSL